mmetsp:Transcript_13845/g.37441  ORF Transcript_13845/g.37441 Transcript_13845/m.37441 type:complete len:90 (-) Transcript_13845:1571-1840(-)|eukprot:1148822-Pelagomonas_calceolata.AAC.6
MLSDKRASREPACVPALQRSPIMQFPPYWNTAAPTQVQGFAGLSCCLSMVSKHTSAAWDLRLEHVSMLAFLATEVQLKEKNPSHAQFGN